MSTAYYRLRSPITSVALDEGPSHDVVRVWETHALAGQLVVRAGAGRAVVLMFALHEDDAHCPLHVWYGGRDRGVVVDVNDPRLDDSQVVIEDNGVPITVGKVKALAGATGP